jgi:hypothetical protein
MKDITPEDSVVPIYLDPTPIAQQEADAIADAAFEAEVEAKAQAKAELLERLGITADEAKLLLL